MFKQVFSFFLDPKGRISRLAFLKGMLAICLISILTIYLSYFVNTIATVSFSNLGHYWSMPISIKVLLILSVLSYSFFVLFIKRLHDLDLTGWWALLLFVGISGTMLLQDYSLIKMILSIPGFGGIDPLLLKIAPLSLNLGLNIMMLTLAGNPKRNQYGLPRHLIPKTKKITANFNPFKSKESETAPIIDDQVAAAAATTNSAHVATTAMGLRREEMNRHFQSLKKAKLEGLQAKMRIQAPKKELNNNTFNTL